jgi:hypothetical protein
MYVCVCACVFVFVCVCVCVCLCVCVRAYVCAYSTGYYIEMIEVLQLLL